MRPVSRLILFGLAVAFATACAGSSGPDGGELLESRIDNGDPNDTAGAPPSPPGDSWHPAEPGTPPDSQSTGPIPPRPLIEKFTVVIHVFDVSPGPDSSASKPIAGARVEMWKTMTADGQAVPRVLAGTAVSDARGILQVPDLPSAHYEGIVTGPPGGGFGEARLRVEPHREAEAQMRYWVGLRRLP